MGFKDLKLKVLRVKKFLTRRNDQISSGSWKYEPANKQPWVLTSISHGFHTFEGNRSSMMHGWDESGESSSDLVVAQREQIQNSEVWMFGLFDPQIGDGVTKYLQSNLFDKKLSKGQINRRTKETIKKAYVSSKAKISGEGGSTSAVVINGKKIVAADIGDYRTVLCKDGVAHLICKRSNRKARRCLSLTIHSGVFRRRSKPFKPSTPEFGVKRIDSKTDFLILASNGIWEVMRSQEAVDLISHIDDPQEAAECLAKEAVTRLAKANISCLVVRFD